MRWWEIALLVVPPAVAAWSVDPGVQRRRQARRARRRAVHADQLHALGRAVRRG